MLHGSPPQQAFAVVLAALAAGYDIESWQHRATGEHQTRLVPAPARAPPAETPEVLRSRVITESATAATRFVRARGEPVQPETLHIAAWHRLLRKGILDLAQASLPTSRVLSWLNAAISQGLEDVKASSLVSVLGDDAQPVGWWLRKVGRGVNAPLSDRVEEAVLTALRDVGAGGDATVEETECIQSIYRRFNGPLTPDVGLVHACLRAYGEEPSPGIWQLHAREREATWAEERRAGVRDLLALGERLGYRVHQSRKVSDVVWEEEGPTYLISTA